MAIIVFIIQVVLAIAVLLMVRQEHAETADTYIFHVDATTNNSYSRLAPIKQVTFPPKYFVTSLCVDICEPWNILFIC